MNAPPTLTRKDYTIEEWLALERETGEKYEYHHGELWSFEAMAGGLERPRRARGQCLGRAL